MAGRQVFSASMETANWIVDASFATCTLSQSIPRLGLVSFEQRANRRIGLKLYVEQPPLQDLQGQLRSEAPAWKPAVAARDLGKVKLAKGKTPLVLPRDMALRVYYELEQGMMPTLSFNDWADGSDQVKIALSPIRFRQVLARFKECTATLPYLDFEPVYENKIYFSTADAALHGGDRRRLSKAVSAYRKRPGLKFVLGGHADERGSDTYNKNLSRRRVSSVKRYLLFRGVPASRIEKRYFGESQPAVQGRNSKAWAKNRRVTVWLAEH